MSDKSFENHLKQLEEVLRLIEIDFQDVPAEEINNWYDQVLDVLYNSEDAIEGLIEARLEIEDDEFEDEDIEYESEFIEDTDIEDADSDTEKNLIISTVDENPKKITININLK